ncbi:MAG: DUF5681 domain-containing protein [Pseudomonadota bacterium]
MSDDYEVGYGKPPKSTRFKKGESGNPYGRPKKKERDPAHDPSSILSEPITVRTNGQVKEMSALEAGLRKKVQEALKTTSTRKLLKAIEMFDDAGLVRRPNHTKHISVVRFPKRWDVDEYWSMLQKNGPPPWDAPDDGLPMDQSLTHPLAEYKMQHGWKS